jgi:beta-glucosidase
LLTRNSRKYAAICATGKTYCVGFNEWTPIRTTRIEPLVDAIIEIWQPGIGGWNSLAGILSGVE